MSAFVLPARIPKAAPANPAEELRFVARQPILDLRGRVHAYELLFRAGPEAVFRGDGDHATRTMLDNTVIFGLEKLTGGLPAFINCTAEALTRHLVDVLPASMTVLEILETVEPTPGLIAACRKLKGLGFRLALDDFVWAPKFAPLVELADYIKVDFTLSGPEARRELFERLRGRSIAMLAEKVETQEEYQQACEEGFTLFQGYYFCRPTLIKNRKVPANRLFHFEILQLLHQESIDLRKVSRLVKRDASLTYRLLRLVNSPLYAMRQEVRSIQSAMVTVGEDIFRRIATLAIASEINSGQPAEILHMAFVRARFCEEGAKLCGCGLDPTEQYLLGMMSLLPAMLRCSMEELAPMLPLREEIRAALEGTTNHERTLLQWLEFHERGDWPACDAMVSAHGIDPKKVAECYANAVEWADAVMSLRG
jgi:EAL and modified HD-GYP domain-containing signal transduction protein